MESGGTTCGDASRLGDFTDSRERLPALCLDLWFQKKWRSARSKAMQSSCDTLTISWWISAQAGRGGFPERRKGAVGKLRPGTTPRQDPAHRIRAICPERPSATRAGQTGDLRLSGLHALLHEDQTRTFPAGRKPVAKRMSRTLKRIKEVLRRRMQKMSGTRRNG